MLDFFHGKAGTDLEDFDVAGQPLVNGIVGSDVRHGDAQQVVNRPAHAVEINDFRDFGNDGAQLLEPFLVVSAGPQQDKHGNSNVEFFRVEQGHPALDDALLFQSLDASPAWSR